MVGYANSSVSNVEVNIDRTTTINIDLTPQSIQTKEVEIIASRPIVPMDLSASTSNINQDQINSLPVQDITQVVGLQAGIQGTTIRGGGEDQSIFLLDGINLKDERSMTSYSKISINSLEEIQIQTGGFNPEYGNARSGVVNIVTKEGEKSKYNFAITVQIQPPIQKNFGPSFYGPMNYWNRAFFDDAVCWTGTKNGAWDSYTQSQYVAFDGWNSIAEIYNKGKDPSQWITPLNAQEIYRWQMRRNGDIKKTDYVVDGAFGGPMPFVSEMLGNLRFFASHRGERTMYMVPLSRDGFYDNNTTLKITSDIASNIKLNISGMYSETDGTTSSLQGYPTLFYSAYDIASNLPNPNNYGYVTGRIYNPEFWSPSSIYRNMLSAKLTYILSNYTLIEASLQKIGAIYSTGPGRMRDTTKKYHIGNAWVDEGPFGYFGDLTTGIDGRLRMGGGTGTSNDRSRLNTYTITANITSQMNENNQLKAGIEFVYNDHDINYWSYDPSLPSTNDSYKWRVFPIRGAIFAQDKIEFEGLIINAGLRLDYSNPNGEWYDLSLYDRLLTNNYGANLENLAPRVKTDKRLTLSPRLGISHPITENSKLYFNYGHFRSMPITQDLYLIQKSWDQAVRFVANPNLPLAKTVAYELGYEHNLFDMLLLHTAAYYKDVTDQPKTVQYLSADSKVNYSRVVNSSYEDIRGIEITLSKNIGEWVSGFINYTYMVATSGYFGIAVINENPADQRAYLRSNIYQEKPIPRPYARANISLNTPRDFGPELMGVKILEDWRLSILPSWNSGIWDTWNPSSLPDVQYNIQWNDTWYCNMRITKNILISKVNLQFIVDINNIFNTKNFNPYGAFSDYFDQKSYMESLHLPADIANRLGPPYNSHIGNDKPGDVRKEGVAYNPNSKDEDTKAYIDNPNNTSLTYLNPRSVFLGLKISLLF
jgi:outer membrane receptor protein involved in Fe transport